MENKFVRIFHISIAHLRAYNIFRENPPTDMPTENSKEDFLTENSEGESCPGSFFEEYGDFLQEIEDCANQVALMRCTHAVCIGPLCALCGKDVATNKAMKSPKRPKARPVPKEVLEEQQAKNRKLYKKHKLMLILDLDQTVIHTTLEPAPCSFYFSITGCIFYVKTRPYLETFLKKVSKLFEISVYTMGTVEYARAVCGHIDPDGKLFGNRIIGRDGNSCEARKDIRKVSCIERNVVILDDRADVWSYSPNLILVRPFWHYNRMDINDPGKLIEEVKYSPETPGELEIGLLVKNEEAIPITNPEQPEHDDELKRLYKLLKKIHAKVFKEQKLRDIRKIIRCKPLKGMNVACTKVFEGILHLLGGTTEGTPVLAIESASMARYYQIPNVKSAWLYEMAYCRRALDHKDYILEDFSCAGSGFVEE